MTHTVCSWRTMAPSRLLCWSRGTIPSKATVWASQGGPAEGQRGIVGEAWGSALGRAVRDTSPLKALVVDGSLVSPKASANTQTPWRVPADPGRCPRTPVRSPSRPGAVLPHSPAVALLPRPC